MASQVSICNKALMRVGQAPIQALTESSTEAAYCRQFYDEARKTTLRLHPWGFAVKVASLAVLADEESYRYSYVYALPADYIRALDVHPSEGYTREDQPVDYEIQGRYLHCDMEDARLRYIADITDTTQFDDQFSDALSYKLASDLAMPITRDANYAKAMTDMYRMAVSIARTSDSNESKLTPKLGRSFLDARNHA